MTLSSYFRIFSLAAIASGLLAAATVPSEARRGRGADDGHHSFYGHGSDDYDDDDNYSKVARGKNCIMIGDDSYCRVSGKISTYHGNDRSDRCVKFKNETYCHD